MILKDQILKSFYQMRNYLKNKMKDRLAYCLEWKNSVDIYLANKEITKKADIEYYKSRPYKNKIGAWASSQSRVLDKRENFLKTIEEFKNKFPEGNNVPRPSYWSGWRVIPNEIEFWLDVEGRVHERLNYKNKNGKWLRELLFP